MALGLARRNEIETENASNRRAREKAMAELRDHGLETNRTNITKFLLWKEQEGRCPYCDQLLGLTDIADGHASHIEHILPRSLTRVGQKRDQIVVAHARCNDVKGDRTPWQAFGGAPSADPERWLAVLAMAERFRKRKYLSGKARLLLLDDWEGVSGEAAIRDFSDRQFHETSWIAKLTAQWLRSVCPRVQVSRGEMTAYLRRIWHLETVIPEVRYQSGLPVYDTEGKPISKAEFERHKAFWEGKPDQSPEDRTDRRIDKRKDHRHHLIDALVIGLSTPKLYQRMARDYQRRAEQPEPGRKTRYSLAIEPPLKDLRAIAVDLVALCQLSHKPDRWPGGPLFKETAYGVAEIGADGAVRMRLAPAEIRAEPREGAQHVLIARKRLAALADARTSVEQARKKLADIASPGVRAIVLTEFERRVAAGETARAALARPIFNPEYRTEIKAVKLRHGDADDAFPVIHKSRSGEHYKLLQHEGYACLEVRPAGKGVATNLVRRAHDLDRSIREPAPEGRRFFKGDSVRDAKDQRVFLIKQIWGQGGGMLVMVPLTEAVEVDEITAAEGLRKTSGRRLLDLEVLGQPCPSTASC
ncbi:type II CRISPR RNA-guided endonuclease Cas9 [Methylolobus aquaticus]